MFRCPIRELWPVTIPVTSLQCSLLSTSMSLVCLIPYAVTERLECSMYTMLLFWAWQDRCDWNCCLRSEAWTTSFSSHCISAIPAQNLSMTRNSEKHDNVLLDGTQSLSTFPDKPWCHPHFLSSQESSLATCTYICVDLHGPCQNFSARANITNISN
jgi:hypothetical protein